MHFEKPSKILNYYISMLANLIGVSTLQMNYEKRDTKNAISLCVLLLKIIKTGRLKKVGLTTRRIASRNENLRLNTQFTFYAYSKA